MSPFFLKPIKTISTVIFVVGLSVACTGPPEFTSALPKQEDVDYDERLLGWWYTLSEEEEPGLMILMGAFKNKAGSLQVVWHLPAMGICWAADVYASKVDHSIYFNATRMIASEHSCEDYTADGEPVGHIVVKARMDESDRLFLRFMRNEFFKKLEQSESIEVRVAEAPAGRSQWGVKYLLVHVSEEKLIELIHSYGQQGLFTEPFGPFHRIDLDRAPVTDNGLYPWGDVFEE